MNPIYEYYQAIRDGSIIAPRRVIQWYEIVVRGLEEKRWFYSPKKAAKAIRFIENFCHHHEGAMAPGLIVMPLGTGSSGRFSLRSAGRMARPCWPLLSAST